MKNTLKKTGQWKCLFLVIVFNPKTKALVLRKVDLTLHKSKEAALGYAGLHKNLPYVKMQDNHAVAWWGNPSWGNSEYQFAIISEQYVEENIGIDITEKHIRRRFREMFKEMFDDWNAGSKLAQDRIYKDMSIELSRWAYLTTIPKGYKLLKVGSVIKETDLEFEKYWLQPNWYNVDKKVKKGQGVCYKNSKGKIYKTIPADNDPLIIRKCI